MEFSKEDMKRTKGLAILFMVVLHLFQTLEYNGLYTPLLFLRGKPVIFYFALLADCCVAIFCFCSGYAQYVQYESKPQGQYRRTLQRTGKVLINYWVIVLLAVAVGLLFRFSERIPGTWQAFLGNFFLLSKSYNGAWWFLLTYLLLMVTSPLTNRAVKRIPPIILLLAAAVPYAASHFYKEATLSDNTVIDWLAKQGILFFNCLFPYLIGCVFARMQFYSKLSSFLSRINKHWLNLLLMGVMLGITVCHAFFPSSIVAPLTGVVIICCFNLFYWGKWGEAVFNFFGNHSTNIWLLHMFFYVPHCGALAYRAKYPLPVLLFTLALCIIASYIVNLIVHPLQKLYSRQTIKK